MATRLLLFATFFLLASQARCALDCGDEANEYYFTKTVEGTTYEFCYYNAIQQSYDLQQKWCESKTDANGEKLTLVYAFTDEKAKVIDTVCDDVIADKTTYPNTEINKIAKCTYLGVKCTIGDYEYDYSLNSGAGQEVSSYIVGSDDCDDITKLYGWKVQNTYTDGTVFLDLDSAKDDLAERYAESGIDILQKEDPDPDSTSNEIAGGTIGWAEYCLHTWETSKWAPIECDGSLVATPPRTGRGGMCESVSQLALEVGITDDCDVAGNDDGVDINDLVLLVQEILGSGSGSSCDRNADGSLSVVDITILVAEILSGSSSMGLWPN